MPNYKTHLAGGLVSFIVITKLLHTTFPSYTLDSVLLPAGLSITLIGSIFPDIDVPSKMQKWFFYSSAPLILLSLLLKKHLLFSLLGSSIIFIIFLTHRTITHKPFFILLAALIPLLFLIYNHPIHTNFFVGLYVYFTTGSLSHILLDRIQSRAKRLLFKKRRF